MINACIFDWDGVIVDSEKYHYIAWTAIAEEIGTEFTYAEYEPFKSAGRAKVIPYLFAKAHRKMTDEDLARYSALREQMITEVLNSRLNTNDIAVGVVEFIKLLKRNNIKCAVASASALSRSAAKQLGLLKLFDAFVDGRAGLPHKPNPDIFIYTARLLNVTNTECALFEDSINGVLAAKNADMKCIGIKTYFTDKADKIIDGFDGANMSLLRF